MQPQNQSVSIVADQLAVDPCSVVLSQVTAARKLAKALALEH